MYDLLLLLLLLSLLYTLFNARINIHSALVTYISFLFFFWFEANLLKIWTIFFIFFTLLQLERAYQPELMVFIVMVTVSTILYVLSDYLKAVVLCFKLRGPPAQLFIGNVLLIKDKDSKSTLSFVLNPLKCSSV